MSSLVDIGDALVELEVSGQGETVLLNHGAVFADGLMPLLREPALTDSYRVVHYRRRGYGRSSAPNPGAGIRGGADDMAALLDSIETSACHLIGHSYGGYVSLEFAARYPDRVQSLALIEAGPLMAAASAPALVSGLMELATLFRNGQADTVVEILLQTLNGGIYRERLDEVLGSGWDEAAQAALATYFNFDVPAALAWQFEPSQAARISTRSLSIVGGISPPVFHETHALLLEWLPRVEGVTLSGLAHCPHWFDAARVAGEVARFLTATPRL